MKAMVDLTLAGSSEVEKMIHHMVIGLMEEGHEKADHYLCQALKLGINKGV